LNIQQVPKKFDGIWDILNLHHVDGPTNFFHEGHPNICKGFETVLKNLENLGHFQYSWGL